MDLSGRVLSTFTDIKLPGHMSLDSKDGLLVADCWNDRVLLLSSQLQLQRVVIGDDNSQVKLSWPFQLCYSERKSQLYVVHRWPPRMVLSIVSLH